MMWQHKPLEEVADFRLGKMLDQKKNRGELRPYLANVNVRWGAFDFNALREMRFEASEDDRYGLRYGDIVMCEGGEPGRCAIWKDERPGMMVQKALHRIRPHEGLDHRFLYYTFLSKGRTGELSGLFTGATIKHLPREKLAKAPIPIPLGEGTDQGPTWRRSSSTTSTRTSPTHPLATTRRSLLPPTSTPTSGSRP